MSEERIIKRGDTWKETITYKTNEGVPIDITGASIRLQVRDKRSSAIIVEASTDLGTITITDAAGGEAALRVEAADMVVALGVHEADIETTYADDTVESSPTFYVNIVKDITYDD